MFGELDNPKNQKLTDLNAREIGIMIPLLVMIFVMGLYPKPFIDKMDPAIKKLVTQVRPASMNAKKMPTAADQMSPAGHTGAGMPAGQTAPQPAGPAGGEMPAGHTIAPPAADTQLAPAANPHAK
jgi:NADH-quinone oxidoreductase subunit M